ncbi:MAG: hypothetical protein LCH78_18075 [Proteobacteria bacterium]|nr:hypothetical protein [Pseudomonadota bacterium]
MEDSMTPTYEPDHAALKKMYEDFQSTTRDGRAQSQVDDDYFHGNQLTPDEKRILQARKQPDAVFNRTRPAVLGTLGVIKQGATDPRAYPRNPGDEDAADVASKVLRYIADKSNFDAIKIDVAKNYLVEGTGAIIVEADADGEIPLTQIRWEELVYDPRSRRQDFGDARYLGVAKWQYADDLKASYPDKGDEIERLIGSGNMADDISDDRPRDGQTVAWVDGRKRRVMTVELYHRDDGWKRCVFWSGGVLEASESPYLDDKGRPTCPIVAQSCYVDRENNRYGIVRDMRGPQDEINKRRSKLLHRTSSRVVQEAAPGQGYGSIEEVRREAAKPDGVLPSGWQIVNTGDMAAGEAQLLAEAKAEIERMGPNPAILGRQGESQSGRANLVRQQAGLTEQAVIFGGIEEFELRVYRQMWSRARQFWQTPMWVRVTDDEGAPQFVGVNQPQTDEFGQQIGVENQIAAMDVDIIIDTVPDTANVQQEQFAMLVELAKVGALGQNPGPLLLEASSLPNKAKVIEKLQAPTDPAQQQMQQQAAELQARGAAAKVAKDEADALLTGAKAQNEQLDGLIKQQAAQAGFGPPQMFPAAGA